MENKKIIPYVAAGAILVNVLLGTGCTKIDTRKLDVEASQISCSSVSSEALEVARDIYGPSVTSLDFRSDEKNLRAHPGALCDLKIFRDAVTGDIDHADYKISHPSVSALPVNAMDYPIMNLDYVAPEPTMEIADVVETQESERANSVMSREVEYLVRPEDSLSVLYFDSCFADGLQNVYLGYDIFESNMTVVGGAGKDGGLMAGQTLKFSVPEDFSLESCLN